VSTGLTRAVSGTRFDCDTPAVGDHAPKRGRIDVSGKTGAIRVGIGGGSEPDYLLDEGDVIDVMCLDLGKASAT
jgi:hypothetical protein